MQYRCILCLPLYLALMDYYGPSITNDQLLDIN